MQYSHSPAHRLCLITGAFIAWLAVGFQLYLILLSSKTSVFATLIQFFSFFTILTNILVAIAFTISLVKDSSLKIFFTRPQTLTAIAVYISVVGLVYNGVLRQLWQPQGLQRVVDELLHLIVPILYFVYWLVFVPKNQLQWKDTFAWLLYPLGYTVYIIIRGAITDLYPYPFMDAGELGYTVVFFNSLMVLGVILFFSYLFIAIAKFKSRV